MATRSILLACLTPSSTSIAVSANNPRSPLHPTTTISPCSQKVTLGTNGNLLDISVVSIVTAEEKMKATTTPPTTRPYTPVLLPTAIVISVESKANPNATRGDTYTR